MSVNQINNIIKGFEWYLPLAFKDSIAQCKFEQGDVIYRQRPKGLNWGEKKNSIDFLIQVKSPSRINISSKDDLSVFNSNWYSKIVFEKIYPNDLSKNRTIETTQGNFFRFLWTNNEKYLSNEELTKPVLTNIQPKNINTNFIKSKIPNNCSGFAIIVDNVSNLLISKRNAISDAFAKNYIFRSEIFEIMEAINLENIYANSPLDISPTLEVELFLVQSENLDEIQELLKNVLFKGEKNRFNIKSHGQLFKN